MLKKICEGYRKPILKEQILTFNVNVGQLALLELVWQMIHVILPALKSAVYPTQCGYLNSEVLCNQRTPTELVIICMIHSNVLSKCVKILWIDCSFY